LPPGTTAPQTPPMPAVELVVTDLDGTFWHTDDHLPDAVLDAVAELERRGIPLLVATGRRLASTRDPLATFGLAPPAIMLNGAIGIDLRTNERFHVAPYPTDQALAAYDAFVAVGLSPVVYVDHPEWDVFLGHRPNTNPAHVNALGDTAGRHYGPAERTMVDDLRQAVATTPVLGYSMIGVPFADAEAAVASLDGVVEVHLDRSIDFPGLASLTAAPRGQSKWDGVLAFCAGHGIDPTRVMAVADGPNDIELLTNAAVRAVPANAHPSAHELATAAGPTSSPCSTDLGRLGRVVGDGGGPGLQVPARGGLVLGGC
jgi:hydroxymethylpyrimidine pyrophosphatase-like HAD family hydrolase